MITYFIYTLSNPKNSEIFYVGCSRELVQRFRYHCSKSNRYDNRGKYIAKMKCHPTMTIVEKIECIPHSDFRKPPIAARELENNWILKLFREGQPLTNAKPRQLYLDNIIDKSQNQNAA